MNTTRKIFLIVRWPVGGIRTFINYVYSDWTDFKIELHILTPKVMEVEVLKKQLTGVSCIWHTTATDKPTITEFSCAASKVMRTNNFDVVHAHGFTSALAVSPLIIFSKAGSIFTSHDVLRENQFVGLSGVCKKVLISIALNRFNVIHSVSNDADQNLKEFLPRVNKDKCRVILNGVDTQRFYSAKAIDLRTSLGISNEVIIGFFGRFMSQKGFKYLVGAIRKLNEECPDKFRVVCFGSGAFIREEQSLLKELGLSHLFVFHDFVADTAPYIKGCDMVVMPSLWEACPLVPMEVLASGIPLVATKCIGLREVCEGTPTVMVEPADVDSLVEGIRSCIVVDKNRSEAYAKTAKERFSIDDVRRRISALYKALSPGEIAKQ
jgi:glycosyltransferase involved in cell wall biosynthesis